MGPSTSTYIEPGWVCQTEFCPPERRWRKANLMLESWGVDHFMRILKKENLPLFGKLNPSNYQEFKQLGDGLVKAYGDLNVSHSNFEPEVVGHICAGNILGIVLWKKPLPLLLKTNLKENN